MADYSIRDLERLSGIKAHTIRMWEKRYKVIVPRRTHTNIRLYSDEDLRHLLNVALLNSQGLRISTIADFSPAEMEKRIVKLSHEDLPEKAQIESLVVTMLHMNEVRFERILSNSILRLGFEKTVDRIIFPFMQRVGLLWQTGTVIPAQEHFICNLVRQKLIVAIDAQGMMEMENPKKFLLFLPGGEMHEIGLLYCAYLLKKAGHRVIYLGQSVPCSDLQRVNQSLKPDFLVTALIGLSSVEAINSTLDGILQVVPQIPVVVSNYLDNPSLPNNPRLVFNRGEKVFENWLLNL